LALLPLVNVTNSFTTEILYYIYIKVYRDHKDFPLRALGALSGKNSKHP